KDVQSGDCVVHFATLSVLAMTMAGFGRKTNASLTSLRRRNNCKAIGPTEAIACKVRTEQNNYQVLTARISRQAIASSTSLRSVSSQ
ncbi:MAG TPA: hypothetical protein VI758_01810, partial [Bacteroidota bacterium]